MIASMSGIGISLIIPSYNRHQALARQLDWLLAQSIDRQQSEVIIVNDGSQDETRSLLEHYAQLHPAWIRPLHQQNQGQAAARQAGAAMSRGRILLFLDDDMEPCSPHFIENHWHFHTSSGSSTVAIGAILPPTSRSLRPAFEYFYERSIAQLYKKFSSGELQVSGQFFFSANVSLPADLFWKVGGFDASYRHAEDRELGLRLEYQGRAAMLFLPEAAAYHHSPTSHYRSFQRRAHLYGYYDFRMAQLYPDQANLQPQNQYATMHPIKRLLWQLAEAWPKSVSCLTPILALGAELCLRTFGSKLAAHLCSLLYTMHYVQGLQQARAEPSLSPALPQPRRDYAS